MSNNFEVNGPDLEKILAKATELTIDKNVGFNLECPNQEIPIAPEIEQSITEWQAKLVDPRDSTVLQSDIVDVTERSTRGIKYGETTVIAERSTSEVPVSVLAKANGVLEDLSRYCRLVVQKVYKSIGRAMAVGAISVGSVTAGVGVGRMINHPVETAPMTRVVEQNKTLLAEAQQISDLLPDTLNMANNPELKDFIKQLRDPENTTFRQKHLQGRRDLYSNQPETLLTVREKPYGLEPGGYQITLPNHAPITIVVTAINQPDGTKSTSINVSYLSTEQGQPTTEERILDPRVQLALASKITPHKPQSVNMGDDPSKPMASAKFNEYVDTVGLLVKSSVFVGPTGRVTHILMPLLSKSQRVGGTQPTK